MSNELKELEKEIVILKNQYYFFKKILAEPAKGRRKEHAEENLKRIDERGTEVQKLIKELSNQK
jgi:hypothetical protein